MPLPRCNRRSLAVVLGALALVLSAAGPALAQEFCTISGVRTSCKPVQWCGPGPSENYSYSWSGPNGFTAFSSCIDVTITGTYTLTIRRNSDGATETCSADFLFTPGDVPCGITGPSTICPGQSAELCGPDGDLEYRWEGPGGFTSTSQCVIVSVPGVYTLVTTSPSSRCEALCTHELALGDCPKPEGRCWLTGGGAKFPSDDGHGPNHSWGGNVNPGCSPTAGEGGQWNHVDHDQEFHAQGRAIQVVRCGNVVGIPPGSTSPVTPFNFIEFQGTGTFKGVAGNKIEDVGEVFFFARAEDRNEPGSNGQNDGAGKDRYFLHVFSDPTNPAGTTLLLVDEDGDPTTVDPITITDGNMQLHISGCDKEKNQLVPVSQTATELSSGVELYRAYPSPFSASAGVRMAFAVPAGGGEVQLGVYDLAGRLVTPLASGYQAAGRHEVSWSGTGSTGERVREGVYFISGHVAGMRVASRVIMVR